MSIPLEKIEKLKKSLGNEAVLQFVLRHYISNALDEFMNDENVKEYDTITRIKFINETMTNLFKFNPHSDPNYK